MQRFISILPELYSKTDKYHVLFLNLLRFLCKALSPLRVSILAYCFFFCMLEVCNLSACGFHFVPFGADWRKPLLYSNYQFAQTGRNFGFLQYNRAFQRNFVLEQPYPDQPPTATLHENISTKNIFSRVYSSHRFQINLALSQSDIRFEGLSEVGVNSLHGWSSSEISVYGNLLLYEYSEHNYHSYVFFDYDAQTSIFSKHGLDHTIGWLNYELEKISPRLLPGNYGNNISCGLTTLFDFDKFQLFANAHMTHYTNNKSIFIFGREINLSANVSYKTPDHHSIRLKLGGGFFYESATPDLMIDGGKNILNPPCGLAKGSDLFISGRMNVEFKQITFFVVYDYPLIQKNFSEHQLYNQNVITTGVGFSFL